MLDTSILYIYRLIIRIILTQYQKFRNKIDTFKMLKTILIHSTTIPVLKTKTVIKLVFYIFLLKIKFYKNVV